MGAKFWGQTAMGGACKPIANYNCQQSRQTKDRDYFNLNRCRSGRGDGGVGRWMQTVSNREIVGRATEWVGSEAIFSGLNRARDEIRNEQSFGNNWTNRLSEIDYWFLSDEWIGWYSQGKSSLWNHNTQGGTKFARGNGHENHGYL